MKRRHIGLAFVLFALSCGYGLAQSPAGTISTAAGNGNSCLDASCGDGGPAIRAALRSPHAVAADGAGNLYIADYSNHRIRKVNASGIISTVAGSGAAGFSGDEASATSTSPTSVTIASAK